MSITELESAYISCKEEQLFGRYINNKMILPLLEKHSNFCEITVLGRSVQNRKIHGIKIGQGSIKVLLWSQMHGNESTTTKAIFDLLNYFTSNNDLSRSILEKLTIFIIPILNPDGAEVYTRVNANQIDLNRDAKDLSQPESKILRSAFDQFQPNYCFNLHGQRTIFGVNNQSAIVAFLAPAQDEGRSITSNRKKAMGLIAELNKTLQQVIPGSIGLYDDSFNINCVGDSFQSFGVPTLLFEAGHYPNDYQREEVRKLIFYSILSGLQHISGDEILDSTSYFKIPKNEKCFFDIIIRNASLNFNDNNLVSVAIQFKETLIDKKVTFIPVVEKIFTDEKFYGHKEIDADSNLVKSNVNSMLNIGNEIDFVFINNEKYLLKTQ